MQKGTGMNIGEAARQSGVPAKTIRYYEEIGLIAPAGRRANGYRDYDRRDVAALHFIHQARSLGFSVREVADLLALWRDPNRAAADVRMLAQTHVAEIDRRMAELVAMRRTLTTLIDRCQGGDRPDCPILETLSGAGGGKAGCHD